MLLRRAVQPDAEESCAQAADLARADSNLRFEMSTCSCFLSKRCGRIAILASGANLVCSLIELINVCYFQKSLVLLHTTPMYVYV